MLPRLILLLCLLAARLAAAEPDALAQGRARFLSNHFPEAKAVLAKAHAAEPDNPEVNYWYGLTLIETGDSSQAIACLEKAAASRPPQGRYFKALGDAYGLSAQKASLFSKMGLARKCIAAYDRAVALEPGNVEYHRSRYEFYRAAPSFVGGGMDRAAAEVDTIEKLDPVEAGGMRADIQLKDGHVDKAFALLDALRKHHPDNRIVLYQFGRMTAMTGRRLDEGEAALKAYLADPPKTGNPPFWAAHWRLAMILEKRGAIAEARAQYEETLRLNPAFTRARDSLNRLPAPNGTRSS